MFTVIIPVADDETLWRQLLPLLPLDAGDDLIIAAAAPPPPDWDDIRPAAARWLVSPQRGRAAQMNAAAAAAAADNDFLWFVHADSRPPPAAVPALKKSLTANGDAIHYFDLHFYDGGAKMILNEWGVRLRCAIFKNPFGDQALCLSRRLFTQLGGFAENAAYGEDNLLMLAAKRQHYPLRRVGVAIGTSARRYRDGGWWNTVLLYQCLWLRQWRQR